MRAPPLVAFGLVASSAIAAACTAEDAVDTNHAGPPNGLAGAILPTPRGATAGTENDASAPPSDGACIVDGCTVSFQSAIFPLLSAGGAWKCGSSGCHSGPNAQMPSIPDDAAAAYASLSAFPKNGTFYIEGCSSMAAQSPIGCNIGAAAASAVDGAICAPEMPLHITPTAEDLNLLAAWLECGAPFN